MNKLKKASMILVLSFLFLSLCGCSRSSQVENQAYVLVMGLDREDDGRLRMSVQLPKISGGGASQEHASSGSYTQFSIVAEDFETALEKLDWAAPRDLNLSHLKLIVLSRDIAEEENCRELIENIAQTERLYTATRVTVCEGKAKDFVDAMQPVIGTRISTDISAMFDHYVSSGFVPESSLADLFYQTESFYSDPMVTYAILEKNKNSEKQKAQDAKPASALSGTIQQISASYESDIQTRYLGAALFVDGRMRGVLSGTQTIIANLLSNNVDAFRYKCDGQSLAIVPTRRIFVDVEAKEEGVHIRIDAKLSVAAQERFPDEEKLRSSLENEIRNTIQAAQNIGCEPFGFAEKAAKSFPTIEKWKDYNWIERFKKAKIEVELSFARSDT